MTSSSIDTIILDLGGVLIDVDYEQTAREFAGLGHENFDELYSKAKQNNLFDDFEVGAISPQQFCDRIRGLVSDSLTDIEIVNAWNAMLGSIPEERLELVQRMREQYQVLLFSNTNSIHVPAFEQIIREENQVANFKSLFDGAYYSCEIGLRKPNKEAFDFVLNAHDASAERTLFIDDSIQHINGARNAGLNAEHLDLDKEDIVAMSARLGVLQSFKTSNRR